MCPEFEIIDRQVANDVNVFEATETTAALGPGKMVIDPAKAVKKFRRSAAGNYELAEDLRPPEVLLEAANYLMRDLLGQYGREASAFPALYGFIRDRTRAIRTDLTLQGGRDARAIHIHELTVRFLIAAGHLLCEEERATFEPQQNLEQLNGCLSALREMYKYQPTSPCMAEFMAYGVLLSLDKPSAVTAISSFSPSLLADRLIQGALEAVAAFQQGNSSKYLRLLTDPDTSYLQACLLHQFMHPLRLRVLNSIASLSDSSSFRRLPLSDFMARLGFIDRTEAEYYASRLNFRVVGEDADLSELLAAGAVVDRRAEEEAWKSRRFNSIIEGQRRQGRSLVQVVFNGNVPAPNPSVIHVPQIPELARLAERAPLMQSPARLGNARSLSNGSMGIASAAGPSTSPLVPEAPSPSPEEREHQQRLHQQDLLRKKLEIQAQDRQRRLALNAQLSTALLDALIMQFAEPACLEAVNSVWESFVLRSRADRSEAISKTSELILQQLIDAAVQDIVAAVANPEIMRLRIRAAEHLSHRDRAIEGLAEFVFNDLVRELVEEETEGLSWSIQYQTRRFLNSWRRRLAGVRLASSVIEELSAARTDAVHILLIGDYDFSSLMKSPNHLRYLEAFLPDELRPHLQMVASVRSGLIVSRLSAKAELESWPANYPAPSVVVAPSGTANVFAPIIPWWEVPVLEITTDMCSSLDELLRAAARTAPRIPLLVANLSFSQFLFFVMGNGQLLNALLFDSRIYEGSGDAVGLFDGLVVALLERLLFYVYRSEPSAKFISVHILTAGRAFVLRLNQIIADGFPERAAKSLQTGPTDDLGLRLSQALSLLDSQLDSIFFLFPELANVSASSQLQADLARHLEQHLARVHSVPK
jgi:hypothetical protein